MITNNNNNNNGCNERTIRKGSFPRILGDAGKGKEVSSVFASILGRGHDSGNESEGTVQNNWMDPIERLAKEKDIWIDSLSSLATAELGRGHENIVFRSKDGNSVIKFNNFLYVRDYNSLIQFIERINSHNEFCLNASYTLLGFTKNNEGKVGLVMSQPYVKMGMEADTYKIETFLKEQGFRNEYLTIGGKKGWTNGIYEFNDAVPRNVLMDPLGNLYFIDLQINNPERLNQYLSDYKACIEKRDNIIDIAVKLSHNLFPMEKITGEDKQIITEYFALYQTIEEKWSAMKIIQELTESRPGVRDAKLWRENAYETIEVHAGLKEQRGEFQGHKI